MKIRDVLLIMSLVIMILAGCSPNQANNQQLQGPASGVQEVRVENGVQKVTLSWGKFNYNPEVIKVKANMPVEVTADLNRITGCFRSFEIPELGVDESFSESKPVIQFTPKKTGTFTFGCSMGMGQGTLVVE